MIATTEKPDTQEQYQTAVNTSNLRIEVDRPNRGDIILAAGMSKSRLGASLLRLYTEWDSSEKLPKLTKKAIETLAATMPTKAGKPNHAKAAETAANWHMHEMKLLMGKLKTLPEVRAAVVWQATVWGISEPEQVTASALLWWLAPTCQTCHGVGWLFKESQPAQICTKCRGSTRGGIPCGEAGRKVVNHLDDCVNVARQSIHGRLRAFSRAGAKKDCTTTKNVDNAAKDGTAC